MCAHARATRARGGRLFSFSIFDWLAGSRLCARTTSLYLEREIFLRELLSNASDALEKRRHANALGGGDDAASTAGTARIELECDVAAGELRVRDSGIGMTKAGKITEFLFS